MVKVAVVKKGWGKFCSKHCEIEANRSRNEIIIARVFGARTTVPLGPYYVDMVKGRTAIEYDGLGGGWIKKAEIRRAKFRRKRRLAHKLGYEFVIIRYDDVKDAIVRRKDGSYVFYAPHAVQELLEGNPPKPKL